MAKIFILDYYVNGRNSQFYKNNKVGGLESYIKV